MAKKKQNQGNVVGSWALIIGTILAIIMGFVSLEPWMALLLVVVGLVVGLLNVTTHEAMGFLHAAAILVIVSALSGDVFMSVIPWLGEILNAILIMVVPATILVALRAIFDLARN